MPANVAQPLRAFVGDDISGPGLGRDIQAIEFGSDEAITPSHVPAMWTVGMRGGGHPLNSRTPNRGKACFTDSGQQFLEETHVNRGF